MMGRSPNDIKSRRNSLLRSFQKKSDQKKYILEIPSKVSIVEISNGVYNKASIMAEEYQLQKTN